MLSDTILRPGGARAEARCREIGSGPFSDTPDGLYRGYLTPAYAAAQRQLRAWMEQAGMSVRLDQAANLIGRFEGSNPAAPALMIGSHLDSVRNGGCYDGPLGILLGVELIAALHAEGRRLPFPIEVYAFGDEEGSRFPKAMLTSRAVAGTLAAEELAVCDAAGISLADAGVEVASFLAAVRPRQELLAYLETHIEQGPVLEAEGLAVGTVTGIVAQRRYVIEVIGMAGHAGTVTMAHRRDALAGASEMVCAIERFALGDGRDLVATVGQLQAYPGAQNVIAGKVRFTLDVRSGDDRRCRTAAEALHEELAAIADRRQLDFVSEPVLTLAAAPCDAGLMDLLDSAIAEVGVRPFRLPSGAGHDAMHFTPLCPTAMLFVRCRGGVSHNPAEHVEPADAEIALAVMRGFVEKLGAEFGRA